MLMFLNQRKANGQPKAFGGKDIASNLGRNCGLICDAERKFRNRVIQLLADAGIEANEDSVIIRGRAGYQINAELSVEDQSNRVPEAATGEYGHGPGRRQQWIVEELKKGRK